MTQVDNTPRHSSLDALPKPIQGLTTSNACHNAMLPYIDRENLAVKKFSPLGHTAKINAQTYLMRKKAMRKFPDLQYIATYTRSS